MLLSLLSSPLALAVVATGIRHVAAITLDVNDPASIRNAASTIAKGMLSYYDTAAGTGILPNPYYWWEAGEMWGGLIDYWHYTGDASYNSIVSKALLANIGPAQDFIVPDQAWDEGNDDQAFWGFATMSAAELGFPAPSSSLPSWVQLTENLWNNQLARWDTSTCGGGLKWQIYSNNKGYDYKNAVSNGAFFQLAARLAAYTGNQTYVDWALKVWDWSSSTGLISSGYSIYDGASDLTNCAPVDKTQWSYNAGLYMLGAATLYNYTGGSALWEGRVTGLVEATATFFGPFSNATGIMFEAECELKSICNPDQYSFKAYLSRAMWKTTQIAPYTSDAITTVLIPSAEGAAASCSGGVSLGGVTGSTCGSRWFVNGFDNVYGVGQQLSAMEVIQGLLIDSASPPSYQTSVAVSSSTAVASSTTAISVPTGTSTSLAVILTTASQGTATYEVSVKSSTGGTSNGELAASTESALSPSTASASTTTSSPAAESSSPGSKTSVAVSTSTTAIVVASASSTPDSSSSSLTIGSSGSGSSTTSSEASTTGSSAAETTYASSASRSSILLLSTTSSSTFSSSSFRTVLSSLASSTLAASTSALTASTSALVTSTSALAASTSAMMSSTSDFVTSTSALAATTSALVATTSAFVTSTSAFAVSSSALAASSSALASASSALTSVASSTSISLLSTAAAISATLASTDTSSTRKIILSTAVTVTATFALTSAVSIVTAASMASLASMTSAISISNVGSTSTISSIVSAASTASSASTSALSSIVSAVSTGTSASTSTFSSIVSAASTSILSSIVSPTSTSTFSSIVSAASIASSASTSTFSSIANAASTTLLSTTTKLTATLTSSVSAAEITSTLAATATAAAGALTANVGVLGAVVAVGVVFGNSVGIF